VLQQQVAAAVAVAAAEQQGTDGSGVARALQQMRLVQNLLAGQVSHEKHDRPVGCCGLSPALV
jgi:hypothetical protein